MGVRVASQFVIMPNGDTHKVCKTCEVAKSLAEFSPHRSCAGGVRSECKKCCAQYTRRWRESNIGRNRENVNRWHASHPDRVKAIMARWRRNNKHRLREYDQRRFAIRRGALLAGISIRRSEIWERDGGKCHICRRACDPLRWHLDHLVPVSRGGQHTPDNVAVSHPKCNQSRGSRGPAQLRLALEAA